MAHQYLDVKLRGYGLVTGLFEQNTHGWFCETIFEIEWDYQNWGVQPASPTPLEAARHLLRHHILRLAEG